MDEIGVWHRTLTSAERTALYNSGLAKKFPFEDIGGGPAPSVYDLTDYNTTGSAGGKVGSASVHVKVNEEYLEADGLLKVDDISRGLTIACWYWPDGDPVGSHAMPFTIRASATYVAGLLHHTNGDAYFYANGNHFRGMGWDFGYQAWNFFGLVIRPELGTYGGHRGFLNDRVATDLNWSSAWSPTAGGRIAVGRPGNADLYYTNGRVDEAMIFDRALSNQEMLGLYAGGAGRFYDYNTVGDSAVHSRWADLMAGWKLDEYSAGTVQVDRADVLGNYTLTDNNTVASSGGMSGHAASLVSADSTYLNHATGPSAQNKDEYLMCAWIRPSGAGTHYYHHAQYGAQNTFFIVVNQGARFYYYGNGGNLIAQSGTTDLTYDRWNFVVMWWDVTYGKPQIQVNNGLVWDSTVISGENTSGTITNAPSFWRIGESSANAATGLIDGFYVFDSIKDAAWRTDMYNAGAGRYYPQ
jgi:hypothetical protein